MDHSCALAAELHSLGIWWFYAWFRCFQFSIVFELAYLRASANAAVSWNTLKSSASSSEFQALISAEVLKRGLGIGAPFDIAIVPAEDKGGSFCFDGCAPLRPTLENV